jgi:hypothetical protein
MPPVLSERVVGIGAGGVLLNCTVVAGRKVGICKPITQWFRRQRHLGVDVLFDSGEHGL